MSLPLSFRCSLWTLHWTFWFFKKYEKYYIIAISMNVTPWHRICRERTSQFRGIYYESNKSRWRARIKQKNKQISTTKWYFQLIFIPKTLSHEWVIRQILDFDNLVCERQKRKSAFRGIYWECGHWRVRITDKLTNNKFITTTMTIHIFL